MVENNSNRPLYFDLHFTDCPHVSKIPLGHGADCKTHCYICLPELRDRPSPGKCFECRIQGRKIYLNRAMQD
jgi:hypothetical protein